jgi:hypothetical protein
MARRQVPVQEALRDIHGSCERHLTPEKKTQVPVKFTNRVKGIY